MANYRFFFFPWCTQKRSVAVDGYRLRITVQIFATSSTTTLCSFYFFIFVLNTEHIKHETKTSNQKVTSKCKKKTRKITRRTPAASTANYGIIETKPKPNMNFYSMQIFSFAICIWHFGLWANLILCRTCRWRQYGTEGKKNSTILICMLYGCLLFGIIVNRKSQILYKFIVS